jgi:hypothetical protein
VRAALADFLMRREHGSDAANAQLQTLAWKIDNLGIAIDRLHTLMVSNLGRLHHHLAQPSKSTQ